MSFLYFLEGLRNPVLDRIFSFFTMFGEETLFLAVGLIIFWCIDKYKGYFILCIGFFGTIINQFLKMLFRIPRPWIKDPDFTIVESAKEAATGYSFPSGHTQVSVGLYGGIAAWNRNKIVKAIAISLCVIVPFSRLYLGVHTPLDVSVSFVIAALAVIFGAPLFKKAENNPKIMYAVLFSLAFINIAFLSYVCFAEFPNSVISEENVQNLLSAKENGFTLLGCIIGFIFVYWADVNHINFNTSAVWWAQILKSVAGIALVLCVKALLKYPLNMLFNGNLAARSVRYFLVVITGGMLWPLTFKYFNKLGQSDENAEQG